MAYRPETRAWSSGIGSFPLREHLDLDFGLAERAPGLSSRERGAVIREAGMDLVLVQDGKVIRNDVYFDRTALIAVMSKT